MNEFQLKYGCNPNQKPSRIFMADGSELPVEILNGRPGYINFLDAFNGYQLVKEFQQRHLLSMYHQQVQQSDFHSQMLRRRYTGLMKA